MDLSKVRRWQTTFSVHRAFDVLPYPTVVVEEEEKAPIYRQDGRQRGDGGGQVVVTISGRGGIRIAGTDYPLTPGRAFLHIHKDPEVCYYYPKDGKGDWVFLWIAFGGGNIEKLIEEINCRYGYLFDVPVNSPLANRLWNYKNHRGELLVIPPLEAAQIVYGILGMLCASAEQAVRQSPRGNLIAEIQRYIAANLGSGVNVEQLAGQFSLSREHLSRCFSEQTGVLLHEYLARERMKAALDLLLQTRLPGKLVADRCGFRSYSVFSRAFRTRFGVAPGVLRKNGFRPEI